MKTKSFICIILLCIAWTVVFAAEVFADSYAEPTPYQIEFENGNKIFYMYPTGIAGDDSCLKSGLYHNTDPLENIYLINMYIHMSKYFYQSELIFSKDGIYFAHMPWTLAGDTDKPDGTAIEFYKNGRAIKKYAVADLVEDNTKLEYTASHVFWERQDNREFDSENNILSVTTVDGIIYKFDIATGDITSKTNMAQNVSTVMTSTLMVVGVMAAMMFLTKINAARYRRKG